jgi:CheY-like chemotaxis protein
MPANVRVLLVDDNATVLSMLRKALAPAVSSIATATDGADALLRIVDESFDLVVTDYQMPGANGRQLLQKIKARPATAHLPIVLMASKADIEERLRSSTQDSVEDFIEKPFFLREAVQRIKRIVDKIALERMAKEAPAADGVLRGTLAQMNVIDLLQSLELGRKTCRLTLSHNNERCDLYFSEGQIGHAVYGDLKGDAAVFHGIAWTDGDFQIDFRETAAPEQSTTLSTQTLLMEGLRILDEANRDSEQGGEAAGAPAVPAQRAQPAEAPQPVAKSPQFRLALDEEDNILEA